MPPPLLSIVPPPTPRAFSFRHVRTRTAAGTRRGEGGVRQRRLPTNPQTEIWEASCATRRNVFGLLLCLLVFVAGGVSWVLCLLRLFPHMIYLCETLVLPALSLALRSYETCVNPEAAGFNPCVEHYRRTDQPSSSSSSATSSSSALPSGRNPSSHSSEGGNGRNGSFVLSGANSQVSASSDGSAASSGEGGGGNGKSGSYSSASLSDEDAQCMEESMHPLPAGTVCDHEAYK